MPIRNQSDIAAIEAIPLSERALPESSYAALVEASKRSPDGQALSFFLSADRLDEAHVWTYAELVADVTRAANLFAALGVAADRPVAYVLPNLPDTHFAIWGGEAAGAALAVNPMLEPRQVADILRFARASILVTLAPALNPKGWSGLAEQLASLPDLSAIAFVDMADYLDGEKRGAARASIEEAAAGSQLKVVNFAKRCASSLQTGWSRRERLRPTTYPHTSAPAERQGRRRLPCVRIGTRCSTAGPFRRRRRPTACREPSSAACPYST